MRDQIEQLLQQTLDWTQQFIPRSTPEPGRFRLAKLIGHRGAPEAPVKENTMDAFQACLNAGVWGVELDIRWTQDHIPVVIHDVSTQRVFGSPSHNIPELSYLSLRQNVPEIPTLEEVLQRFGGRMHLMIEIKSDILATNTAGRVNTLKHLLEPFTAGQHFHFLALDPGCFYGLGGSFSKSCFVAVSTWNARPLVEKALKQNWGGVTGHYLLFNNKSLNDLKRAGMKTGTGFINHWSVLRRELNRDVEWIFSDAALQLRTRMGEHLRAVDQNS